MTRYVIKKDEAYVFSTIENYGAVNYTLDKRQAAHFLTLEQAENFTRGYGLFFSHVFEPVPT